MKKIVKCISLAPTVMLFSQFQAKPQPNGISPYTGPSKMLHHNLTRIADGNTIGYKSTCKGLINLSSASD